MLIYLLFDKGFLVKDVVLIIINMKDKLVIKVLFSCKEIKIFVVDISKLEYIDDIWFYEFGVMKNERVQRDYVLVVEDEKVIKVLKKNFNVMRKGIYMLKRFYYFLKGDISFKRRIYELFDWKGD